MLHPLGRPGNGVGARLVGPGWAQGGRRVGTGGAPPSCTGCGNRARLHAGLGQKKNKTQKPKNHHKTLPAGSGRSSRLVLQL